ncbi:MAG: hypothetical protein EXR75_15525 [Myxococcales bacterium]|nr:hypothetical protein [Myxococcales bacterium]
MLVVERDGWHAWERDRRAVDDPVEVLVGGKHDAFLRDVMFEQNALGEKQGDRQLVAEQSGLLCVGRVARTGGGTTGAILSPDRLHALTREFEVTTEELYAEKNEGLGSRSRTRADAPASPGLRLRCRYPFVRPPSAQTFTARCFHRPWPSWRCPTRTRGFVEPCVGGDRTRSHSQLYRILASTTFPRPVWLLVGSCLALLVGPALTRVCGERRGPLALLDGFVVAALVGLLALDVLPEALTQGGPAALAAVAVGVALPRILEGRLHLHGKGLHGAMIWGAVLGYGLHAVFDGAALVGGLAAHDHAGHALSDATLQDVLSGPALHDSALGGHALHDTGSTGHAGHGHGESLGLSVILHRVPVGVTLWWLVRPSYGKRGGVVMVALVSAATTLGYFGARTFVPSLPIYWLSIFQALVAGSLLHVVLHPGEALATGANLPRWSAAGALAAVALLALHESHALISGAGHALGVVPLFLALSAAFGPAALASLVLSSFAYALTSRRAAAPANTAGLVAALAGSLRSCGCHLAGLVGQAPVGHGSERRLALLTATLAFGGAAGALVLVALAGVPAAIAWLAGAGLVTLVAGELATRFGRNEAQTTHAHSHLEHANSEHANSEHGNSEHGNSEHGNSEHGNRDHHNGEHVHGEHANSEHAKSDHHTGEHVHGEHANSEHANSDHHHGERAFWPLLSRRAEHLFVELALGAFLAAFLGALELGPVLTSSRWFHPELAAIAGIATYFGSAAIVPIALVASTLGLSAGGVLTLLLVAPLPAGSLVSALSARGRRSTGVALALGWAGGAALLGHAVDALGHELAFDLGGLAARSLSPMGAASAALCAFALFVALLLRGPRALLAHAMQGDQHEHH